MMVHLLAADSRTFLVKRATFVSSGVAALQSEWFLSISDGLDQAG